MSQLTCPECMAEIELEILSLDPPKAEMAPMEAEDWGE